MSDRYESQGAALIQFYGWLRETGEIDRLIDLVIEKVRDSRQTEKAKDSEPPLRAENERLREVIEIEREGQRSMARALSEINRLSRLDVAIKLAPPAPEAGR